MEPRETKPARDGVSINGRRDTTKSGVEQLPRPTDNALETYEQDAQRSNSEDSGNVRQKQSTPD